MIFVKIYRDTWVCCVVTVGCWVESSGIEQWWYLAWNILSLWLAFFLVCRSVAKIFQFGMVSRPVPLARRFSIRCRLWPPEEYCCDFGNGWKVNDHFNFRNTNELHQINLGKFFYFSFHHPFILYIHDQGSCDIYWLIFYLFVFWYTSHQG